LYRSHELSKYLRKVLINAYISISLHKYTSYSFSFLSQVQAAFVRHELCHHRLPPRRSQPNGTFLLVQVVNQLIVHPFPHRLETSPGWRDVLYSVALAIVFREMLATVRDQRTPRGPDMTSSNQSRTTFLSSTVYATRPPMKTGNSGACAVKSGPLQGCRSTHRRRMFSLSCTAGSRRLFLDGISWISW
jgi:hypothetical protein